MKKLILLIVLFSNSFLVHSQAYFNFRFEFGQTGWWDGANNIILTPDGYVIGGGSSFYSPMSLGFYKIGFQGDKIFSKIISNTVEEYYLGNPGSIVRLNDTIIVATGSRNSPAPDWIHQEGLVYFLNNNFDTLFTKSFGDKVLPIDTAYLLKQIKVINGNRIIAVGGKMPYGKETNIILIKMDGIGNAIWEKSYGYGAYFDGYSVICTSDNGFAIGGYTFDFLPPPNLTGDPVVYKTDSAGNFKWSFNYGTPYIDTPGMLCSTQDGNMVLGFGYCDSMSGGGTSTEGNPFRRISLIKIDNEGDEIWNKKFGTSEYEKTLLNIRENSDGTLIASGITHHSKYYTSKDYGWLLKTTSEGDSLWYREYIASDGEETDNWLYDVLETPDKGYLACGVVYPESPDTGSQDGWILKVDSLGCERVDYCWVGMKEETPLPSNEEIEIYPNPAEEEALFDLRFTNYDLRIEICLYDIFGREVKTLPLAQGQSGLKMDVSNLPPGLYVAVVESDNRIIARKKLVKK
jgi:hypothetical protein